MKLKAYIYIIHNTHTPTTKQTLSVMREIRQQIIYEIMWNRMDRMRITFIMCLFVDFKAKDSKLNIRFELTRGKVIAYRIEIGSVSFKCYYYYYCLLYD